MATVLIVVLFDIWAFAAKRWSIQYSDSVSTQEANLAIPAARLSNVYGDADLNYTRLVPEAAARMSGVER